jgi:sigma-B regulation protein RsbU (phosphoserine phosphatase)
MRLRWKLLILLLIIGLSPLTFISLLQHASLRRLGSELGIQTRETLIERAGHHLLQFVDNYGTILRRETQTIELQLRAQAREVERCLATAAPSAPQVFWAEEFDRGANLPADMSLSTRHFRIAADGTRVPVPVTYEQQVLKLAPGVGREEVVNDAARLSLMPLAYRFVWQGNPDHVYWQYTALASGLHSSYPGHGGYPLKFDPRERVWYRRALEVGDLIWNPPVVDASTREVTLSVSMPVRGPDGSIAGVTGIDVKLLDVVEGIRVPTPWSAQAHALIVQPATRADRDERGLLILAHQGYLKDQDWEAPIEREWLESSDTKQTRALIADMVIRPSGLRKMPYQGRDGLWVFGSAGQDTYFLLIVPYGEIIAQAVAAEAKVLDRTRQLLQTAGLTLAVVMLIVLLCALLGSRTVTRPVAHLAETARRIAAGDFEARAEVTRRDELGELGRTFNNMVPQLADRIRLRESLSLAMQVQQRLLPSGAPQVEGLDVAGRSIYCDETGGDYYDFLDLTQLGPRRLGVAVGDVTGHGIAAALLMATGRALLRIRAAGPGSLAEMMSDINRQLAADTGGNRFMTLVYLLVDSQTRTLRWVCAGHDPPITYDPASGEFGELRGGGIPLGITAEWRYEEFSSPAPPDEQIVVIGTDGIWEARNPAGDMFGKERLRRIIRENAQRDAREISVAVTDALAAFRRTRAQEDDVTLVVVKVLAPSGAKE